MLPTKAVESKEPNPFSSFDSEGAPGPVNDEAQLQQPQPMQQPTSLQQPQTSQPAILQQDIELSTSTNLHLQIQLINSRGLFVANFTVLDSQSGQSNASSAAQIPRKPQSIENAVSISDKFEKRLSLLTKILIIL